MRQPLQDGPAKVMLVQADREKKFAPTQPAGVRV
jgi:hypothetical protein